MKFAYQADDMQSPYADIGDVVGNDRRSEEELRDFSYIVSHDLATEFRHVAEFTKLLLQEPDVQASESWRVHAQIISSAANKCQTMLEQVRIYSRVQQAPLAISECNLARLAESAVLRAIGRIRETGAVVAIDVDGRVRGDQEMLSDALFRLVENALQFPRPDAPLRVSVTGAARPGGAWAVRIVDNGVGLEQAHWEKAFRMFWRLSPKAGGGVGSGLAISRRILRRHGGNVRFVAHEGGACVELIMVSAPEPGGGGSPA